MGRRWRSLLLVKPLPSEKKSVEKQQELPGPSMYWVSDIRVSSAGGTYEYGSISIYLLVPYKLAPKVPSGVVVVAVFTLNRSTQRHQQYTQCPSWLFILERYELRGHRL